MQQPARIGDAVSGALVQISAITAGLAVLVLLILPRSAPFLMLVMAVPALVYTKPEDVRIADFGRPPLLAALCFNLYLFINSTWSQVPAEALGKSLLFAAIVAVLWLCRRGLARLPDDALETGARVAMIAFIVALAFLFLEEMTRHQVKKALFNWLPFLRPDEKHIQLDGVMVSNIYLYVSNRSMAAVMLSLWPVLLGVMTAGGLIAGNQRRRWLWAGLIMLVTGVTIGKSQHETSALALLFSGAAVALSLWSKRIAIALVAVAWIVSTLAVIPIVSHAYTTEQLHNAMWLPKTARERIIIWGYTAEQIEKAPLAGIGIDSGKVLDERQVHEKPPGHIYPRRAAAHSHNVYVQTWYELGAIGAVLLCALGLSILLAISRLELAIQSYALGTFVAAAVIAAFSYGMWQPWFMALFGVGALLLLTTGERARRTLPA